MEITGEVLTALAGIRSVKIDCGDLDPLDMLVVVAELDITVDVTGREKGGVDEKEIG